MPEEPSSLLEVRDLAIGFSGRGEVKEAVRGIGFSVRDNRSLAIVGESGSGKTVSALALTRLLPDPPACRVSGEILYRGEDLMNMPERQIRRYRGKEIAYIFQEPSTSLNPVYSVGYQIAEAIRQHFPGTKDVDERVVTALGRVGIRDPEQRVGDFPHQLSGGMQQRVMIAMALACEPRLLVADEPTTALDVTTQAQIMDLLKRLRAEINMAVILITHNFGIVADFADEVAVMFRGEIVESGPTARVLGQPEHPYTRALIKCIPQVGGKRRRLTTIDYSALNA
jgi:ABC-type dipeptide/oligopeptide/nickel transport system ATPase component